MNCKVMHTGNSGHLVYQACIRHELTEEQLHFLANIEQWPKEFHVMCLYVLRLS